MIDELFSRIETEAGIVAHSVEITITETPRVNRGIRGRTAADLAVGYSVEGVQAVTVEHRAWVRGLFRELLSDARAADADTVALELTVLYDGAMVGAQAEPGQPWAAAARSAASNVVDASSSISEDVR